MPDPQHDVAEVRASRTITRRPGRAETDPVGHARRRNLLRLGLAWGTPVALLLAWQVAADTGALDTRFFPAPTAIWAAGVESASEGVLGAAVMATLVKVVIGFGVGVLGGLAVGVLLGTSWIARAALEPVMIGLYTVPKLALFPVLLLIFGLGDRPQVVLVAISVFFVMAISTTAAVRGVSAGHREAAQVCGVSRVQMLRHVLLPGAMPAISTALRLSAGIAVLVVVAVELVSAGTGLGSLIFTRWQIFDPETMYAGVVVAGALGVTFTGLVSAGARRLCPWAHDAGLVIR